MSDYLNVAMWCENSLTVSTACTPHGSAKCDQNQVELGASLARAATAWRLEEAARRALPQKQNASGPTKENRT